MAYQRINFKDQNVERPRTYEMFRNPDGTVTFTNSFGKVTQSGTPINAANMNHIEDGVAACAIEKHTSSKTYSTNDLVSSGIQGDFIIHCSLKDGNKGNPLTNETYWKEAINAGKITSDISALSTSIETLKQDIRELEPKISIYLKKSYVNGTSGYNVWSNGYCEQWGEVERGRDYSWYTISFLKPFRDTNYNITYAATYVQTAGDKGSTWAFGTRRTDSFDARNAFEQSGGRVCWKVCGYLAAGSY